MFPARAGMNRRTQRGQLVAISLVFATVLTRGLLNRWCGPLAHYAASLMLLPARAGMNRDLFSCQ